jgi:hypothetical protein
LHWAIYVKIEEVHNNPTLQQNVVQSIHQWIIVECADVLWHEHINDESYSSELKFTEIAPMTHSHKAALTGVWQGKTVP